MQKRALLQGLCAASVVLSVACQPSSVPSTTPTPSTSASPAPGQSASPGENPSATPEPAVSPSVSPSASAPPAVVEGSSSAVIDAPEDAPVVALTEIKSIVVSSARFLNDGAGSTTQLRVSLKDAAGNAVKVEDVKLIFESLNPNRFSVSADGTVTALVDFGTGKIQVTEPVSGLSASLDISVSSGTISGGGGGGGGGGSVSTPTPTPSPTPSAQLGLSLSYAGLGRDVFRVNTTTEDIQEDAAVAMDANGNYVVVWESAPALTGEEADEVCGNDACFNVVSESDRLSGADGDGSGIFGQRFRADGVPLGPEFQINSFTRDAIMDTQTIGDGDTYFWLNGQDTPDVAMNASGQFVVVWESDEQDGDQNGIFAQRYNAGGQPVGGEFQVNTMATGEQDNPSVAIRNDGSFVVAWEHEADEETVVHYRAFTAEGNPVSDDQMLETNSTSEVHVAASASGEVTIAWEDQGFNITAPPMNGPIISFQRLNSSSAKIGTMGSVVATGHADSFDLAYLANNQLVIGWEYSGDAYFNIYNSANTALLTEPEMASEASSGSADGVAVTSNGATRFALSWDSDEVTSDSSVYTRAYSYSNAMLDGTSEMRINNELGDTEAEVTDNDRDDAHLAMDMNGNLVIVWEADFNHPADPVFGVFGKLLTNNGDVK